jgi:hypothetical protein
LSEFQLRDFGVKIDSICHKHGGTQEMVIQGVGSLLVIPLELAGCIIHFKQRIPTTEEVKSNVASNKVILHGIRHHFLIKLQTSYISRSLIMNTA